MAGMVHKLPLGDLAKRANELLTIPIPAAGPLSPQVGREIAQIAVSDVKQRFMTGTAPDGTKWKPLKYPRPNGGDQPLRDTGQLMASIVGESSPTEVVVGTNRQGARLMHFGGKVVPKNAKVLTIPMTKEAKRAGSPRRFRAPKNDDRPLWAKWINGQLVGHFLCVKSVTVEPRPFMGLTKTAMDMITRVLADDATKRWQEGK